MNRIRIACFLTIVIGAIYGSAGLLTSLGEFALGVIVAMCGLLGLGAIDYADARRDERIYEQRVAVWARRDEG